MSRYLFFPSYFFNVNAFEAFTKNIVRCGTFWNELMNCTTVGSPTQVSGKRPCPRAARCRWNWLSTWYAARPAREQQMSIWSVQILSPHGIVIPETRPTIAGFVSMRGCSKSRIRSLWHKTKDTGIPKAENLGVPPHGVVEPASAWNRLRS